MIGAAVDGPVWTLRLDRPEKRNAMTPGMLAALGDRLGHPPTEATCLVLLGSGPTFSAGFDLDACRDDPEGTLRDLLEGLADVIGLLRDLPMPVVIGVQGAAVAGGCALLGGADVVVAEREARLGYPAVRLGISPAVSAATLRALVGDGAARSLLLDPGMVSGQRAAELGLVDVLVDDAAGVEAESLRIGALLAGKPRHAAERTRAWLAEIERVRPEDRASSLEASLSLVGSAECAERLERVWAGGGS